jgi:opacity protein-like surface antigen
LRHSPLVVSTRSVKYILVGILFASACLAQQGWEIGGTLGYGWNRNVRVNGAGAEAAAGIQNRFAAGMVVGEDLYDHIAGEVRYLYQDGDPRLAFGNTRVQVQGQSHTFVYDLLFHVRAPSQRLRPYVAVGAGGKLYRTTGPAPASQPLAQFATLVQEDEWRFVTSIGFGVKYRVHRNVAVRADFRDYIAPFPRKIFVPAQGATGRGLFQQFTPMVGVGYCF